MSVLDRAWVLFAAVDETGSLGSVVPNMLIFRAPDNMETWWSYNWQDSLCATNPTRITLQLRYGDLVELQLARESVCHKSNTNYVANEIYRPGGITFGKRVCVPQNPTRITLPMRYGDLVELHLARESVCHKSNTNYVASENGLRRSADGTNCPSHDTACQRP
jgi:hypothetical protein